MRVMDYPMVGNGHRRAGPVQDRMHRVHRATGDLWLEWWCRPERCRGLIEAVGADPSTGLWRTAAPLALVGALLAGCGSPVVTDPCDAPAVDTVVVAGTGDTLVVSTQLCLSAPPIGGGW